MAGNARHTHVHPAGLTRHDDRRRQGHTSERTPHLDVPAERHEPYRQGAQPSSTLVLGSRRAATQLWHSPRLITDAGSGPAAGWRARPPAQHSGSVYGWRPPPLGRRLGRIELSSLLALRWRRLCVLPAARRRRRTAAPWRRGRPLSGCGRSRRGPARVMAGSRLAATPWSRVLAPRPPARVPRLLRILVPGGGRIQARPGPRPLGSAARARGGRLGVRDGGWAGQRPCSELWRGREERVCASPGRFLACHQSAAGAKTEYHTTPQPSPLSPWTVSKLPRADPTSSRP